MEDLPVDNPVTVEPVTQEPAKAPTYAELDALEADLEKDNGKDAEGEESEEVDYEGKRYKVPKELAPLISKAESLQADATRKTMAAAEMRKEAETRLREADNEASLNNEIIQEVGQLRVIEARVNQFANVNWQQWFAQDPASASAAQMEYTQLRDAHQQLQKVTDDKKAHITATREQRNANALGQAIEALGRPDTENGWDGKFDAPKQEKLTKFGLKLGFSREELANTSHPIMIKVLNLAMMQSEALAKQRAAVTPAKPVAIPVPQVGTRKSGNVVQGLSDDLSHQEWLKRREAQVRKSRPT